MSPKDQDDYDAFGRLHQYARWQAFKAERDRADRAEARTAELEEHTDTAIKCISDRNAIYEEAKGIEVRLESIETIYRDNYGNATMMHLALVEVFGVPEATP